MGVLTKRAIGKGSAETREAKSDLDVAKEAQAKQFDARAALLLEIGDSDDLMFLNQQRFDAFGEESLLPFFNHIFT